MYTDQPVARRLVAMLFVPCLALPACTAPDPAAVEEPDLPLEQARAMGPPPISEQELRQVWVPGFWIESQVQHGDARAVERTVVLEQKPEGPLLASIDALGAPSQAALARAPRTQMSWADLVQYTHLPEHRSRRVRAQMDTTYGTQDGWLVEVEDPMSGQVESRWFFGDCCPGPALFIERFGKDGTDMELQQLGRADRPTHESP